MTLYHLKYFWRSTNQASQFKNEISQSTPEYQAALFTIPSQTLTNTGTQA